METQKQPKISVVFPIYNNEQSIEKCIRSVMDQTLKEIELILIDDGSTGRTPEICDKLAEEDDRIRVIHKSNAGSAAGRNQGIELARGEYIAFVESDDSIAPNMYEDLYKCAKVTSADIIKCGFYFCEGKKKMEAKFFYTLAEEGDVFKAVDCPKIFSFHASIWAGCYRRDFLNRNKLRFIETPSATYSDFSWMVMTYAYAEKIAVVHEPLYFYTYDNPASSFNQSGSKCLYKPFHCLEANKMLREAGIFDKVKEEVGISEYRTCQGHARKIKHDLRDDYFEKYREVMCSLDLTNFKFLYFSRFDKFVAGLIVDGREKLFYNIMNLLNLRTRIGVAAKKVPLINKFVVNRESNIRNYTHNRDLVTKVNTE